MFVHVLSLFLFMCLSLVTDNNHEVLFVNSVTVCLCVCLPVSLSICLSISLSVFYCRNGYVNTLQDCIVEMQRCNLSSIFDLLVECTLR